jgi:hypothetical protein
VTAADCIARDPSLTHCSADGACLECEPDTTVCTNDVEIVCDSMGAPEQSTPCPLGCHSQDPRCAKVNASNGMNNYLDMAADAVELDLLDGATIDTDSGDIMDGNGSPVFVASVLVAAPNGGVAVRVFPVRSLTLRDATVVGTNALTFAVHEEAILGGLLDLSANLNVPGAGGLTVSNLCHGGAGTFESPDLSGGGGGGFGSTGAAGGTANSVQGGTAGASSGAQDLQPLRGGCRGGTSNGPIAGEFGGAGGGALQITSNVSIDLNSVLGTGQINAGGGGASFFCAMLPCRTGGPGGGSGGAVMLEAPTVSVGAGGGIAANGGGGGCVGTAGENAAFGIAPAAGAQCADNMTGSGGSGGTRDDAPVAGETLQENRVGGGGGAVGRIRINTASGALASDPATVLSPQPSIDSIGSR